MKTPGTTSNASKGSSALVERLATAVVLAVVVGVAARGRNPATPPNQGASIEPTTQTAGDPRASDEPSEFLVRLDNYQRERPWLAFPLAVAKKFGEDRAGYLAALVAYFGFFSIFPLMLAFTSVLGFVVTDPEQQREFSDAAANQIPVVGDTIRNAAGQIDGSVVAIVVGVLVALWAGLRIVDAMQNALNEVWDLPRTSRPKLLRRRLKGVLMLVFIGGALIASIAVSNLATLVDTIPGAGKAALWGASALVSVLLYLLAFQLLTDVEVPWRALWPGAVFGGLSWWALQTFGSVYIINQQQSAGETYGQFASVIALMAFLFLAAQLSILGAEISAVKARRLWPRSLMKGRFTDADLAVYEHLAASTVQDEEYEISVVVRSAPTPVRSLPSRRRRRGGGRAW